MLCVARLLLCLPTSPSSIMMVKSDSETSSCMGTVRLTCPTYPHPSHHYPIHQIGDSATNDGNGEKSCAAPCGNEADNKGNDA